MEDNKKPAPLYYVWWSPSSQQARLYKPNQYHLMAQLEDGSEVEYNAMSNDEAHKEYNWTDMQLLGRGRFSRTNGRLT